MRQIEDLEYVQVQRAPSGGSFRYRLLPQRKRPPSSTACQRPRRSPKKRKKRVKTGNRPKTAAKPHEHRLCAKQQNRNRKAWEKKKMDPRPGTNP